MNKKEFSRQVILEVFGFTNSKNESLETANRMIERYEEAKDKAEESGYEEPDATDFGLIYSMNTLVEIVIEKSVEEFETPIVRNTVITAINALLADKDTPLSKGRLDEVPFTSFSYPDNANAVFIFIVVSQLADSLYDSEKYQQLEKNMEQSLKLIEELRGELISKKIKSFDVAEANLLSFMSQKIFRALIAAKKIELNSHMDSNLDNISIHDPLNMELLDNEF